MDEYTRKRLSDARRQVINNANYAMSKLKKTNQIITMTNAQRIENLEHRLTCLKQLVSKTNWGNDARITRISERIFFLKLRLAN